MRKRAAQSQFGSSGASLWKGLFSDKLDPAQLALLTEACRIVDRLDKLEALIAGSESTWFDLRETFEGSGIAEIVINKPLAEARQQALALKQILAELRQARGLAAPDVPSKAEGGKDELAARRAQRIADTAGR